MGRLLEASRALTESHEATLRRRKRHDAIRRSMCLRTTAPADAPAQAARQGLFKLVSGSATSKVERLGPDDAKELLAWHRTGYSHKARSLCSFDPTEVRWENGKVFSGSLLHAAAFEGNPFTVAVLVDALGLPVDDEDLLGRTPAHIAAMEGQKLAMRTLLARGADPLAKDAAGQTPLSLAWFRVRSNALPKRGWENEDMVVVLQDAVDRERETGSRDGAEPFPVPAEMAKILSWDPEGAGPGDEGSSGARPDAAGDVAGAASRAGAGAQAAVSDESKAAGGDGASTRSPPGGDAAAPTPSTPRSRVARFAPDCPRTPSLFKSPGASLWFGSGSAKKRARTPGSAGGGPLVFTPIEAVPAPLSRLPALAKRLGHLLLIRGTVRGARAREEFDRRVFVLCTEAAAAARQLPPLDAGPAAAGDGSAGGPALQALMDRAFSLAFPPATVAATVLFDPSTRRSRAFEAAIGAALADLPPSDRGAWAEGLRGMSCAVGMPEGTGSPFRSQLWFAVLTVDKRSRFPAQGSPHDRERRQPRVTLEQISCPEGAGVDSSVLSAISAQVLSPTSPYAVEAVVGPLSRRQGSAVVSQWRAAINAALAASRCDADCDKTGSAIADEAEGPRPHPTAAPGADPLSAAIAAAVLPSGASRDEGTAAALQAAAQLARRSPHALRCPSRTGAGFCEASAVQAGKAAAESLNLQHSAARCTTGAHFHSTDRTMVLWAEAKAHAARVGPVGGGGGASSGAGSAAGGLPDQGFKRLAFKQLFSPGAVPHSPSHASPAGQGGQRHNLAPFPLSRAAQGGGWTAADSERQSDLRAQRSTHNGSDGGAGEASASGSALSTGMRSAVSASLSARSAALRHAEGEDGDVASPSSSFDGDAASPPGPTPIRDLSAVMQQAAVSPVSAEERKAAEPDAKAGRSGEAEPTTEVRESRLADMFGGSGAGDELPATGVPGAAEAGPEERAEPEPAEAPAGAEGLGRGNAEGAWADSDEDWSLGAMEGEQEGAEAEAGAETQADEAVTAVPLPLPETEARGQPGEPEGAQGTGGDALPDPAWGEGEGPMVDSVSASSMFADQSGADGGPYASVGDGGDAMGGKATSIPEPNGAPSADAWGDADWDVPDASDEERAVAEAEDAEEAVAAEEAEEEEAEEEAVEDEKAEEAEEEEEGGGAASSVLEAASAVTSSLFQAWKDATGQEAEQGGQDEGRSPGDDSAGEPQAGEVAGAGDTAGQHSQQAAEPEEGALSASSFFGGEEAGDGWADSAFEDDAWNEAAGPDAEPQDAEPAAGAADADAEVAEEGGRGEREAALEDEADREDAGSRLDAGSEAAAAEEGVAAGPASDEGWDDDQAWEEAEEPGSTGGVSAFPPLSPSDGTTPTGQGAGSFFSAPAGGEDSAAAGAAEAGSHREDSGSGGAALSSFFEGEAGTESAAEGLFSSAPAPSPEAMTTQVMHAVTDIMDAHEQPAASAASFFEDGAAAGAPAGLDGDEFIAPDSSDDW